MQEIKCPKCGEAFAVDESGYAQIVQQVRDKEFEKALQQREKEFAERQGNRAETEGAGFAEGIRGQAEAEG